MKKRILLSAQITVLVLFIFSFLAAILPLFGSSNPLSRFDHNKAVYNNIEAFDPALVRLNSLKKLEKYCDSIYGANVFAGGNVEFEKNYTDIVSSVIRNRFFHGYSYYGFGTNYVAALTSKVTIPGLSALVMPDEILKYPYAACSQQSIVMMEVLKAKGFSTRKVAFLGKTYGGHFAFEVLYDGGWHFYDPNMEPDKKVLDEFGRPGIAFLVHNPEVLLRAYSRNPKEEILDIFPTYSYGPVNKFPAPKAIIFQRLTLFLSYSIWLLFLAMFIFIRRKYLRMGKRAYAQNQIITMHPVQGGMASAYYPGA